jgi:ABC-type Fe3+/spermidine/putrescine transport system ATPase subunit
MANPMARHGARLELRGLAKRYAEVVALQPTDLVIEPGEFFSIIGPSGSGKSTLLGMVAGFVAPTGGHIEVDGSDIAGLPPYERNIGMVFQNYALFPHMSVAENIAFPLKLRKLPRREVASRVARMLDTVRLGELAGRRPSQLSGGQQQRVALARAAVYDPRILLMDEPLGALDKNLREEMQLEIKAFHRQIEGTVLYVTHDQDEAAAMSDRIAIMNHGRIEQCGIPRDLYEHPRNAFVASFLGSANLLEVSDLLGVSAGAVAARLPDGRSFRAVGSGEPIDCRCRKFLCIRPESIQIGPAGTLPPDGEANAAEGVVVDGVYTAGTFKYRVDIGTPEPVSVRLASVRSTEMIQAGEAVTLAWPASATLLIPEE